MLYKSVELKSLQAQHPPEILGTPNLTSEAPTQAMMLRGYYNNIRTITNKMDGKKMMFMRMIKFIASVI